MSNKWDNNDNMKKMQQDAIRRVQEMQSRAKEQMSKSMPPEKEEINHTQEKSLPLHNSKPKKKVKRKLHSSSDLIKSFTQDSEKNLILMLIFLLIDEDIDPGLVLSLLYLII